MAFRAAGLPGLAGMALATVLLAACVPETDAGDTGAKTAGVIEISRGGSFSGGSSVTIYADDTMMTSQSDPGGPFKTSQRRNAPAGAFQRASAVVAVQGPKVAAQLKAKDDGLSCLDYGSDWVAAKPPIGGFSKAGAGCPEPALDTFISNVLGAIAAP
ncbi:MAG: hypothetical protein WAT09_17700 [Paracoccaceae bacterium]